MYLEQLLAMLFIYSTVYYELGLGFGPLMAQKLWHSWPVPVEPSLAEKVLNISVISGRTVLLPCKVANLQDKTISWIREKDLTVLTVDTVTYTGDQRFSVKHQDESEDWLLELSGVQLVDEGTYDCQLNTHPKKSTKVNLRVVSRHSAEASFLDIPIADTGISGNYFAKNGKYYSDSNEALISGVILKLMGNLSSVFENEDTFQIICLAYGKAVEKSFKEKDQFIGWTMDEVPVTSLFPEWKVIIDETRNETAIQSQLTIKTVAPDDSGQLACIAPGAQSVSFSFNVKEIESQRQYYSGQKNRKKQYTEIHRHAHQLKSPTSSAARATTPESSFFIVSWCFVIALVLSNSNIIVRCRPDYRKT